MNKRQTRLTQVQKKIGPVRPPEQKSVRQQEQAPVAPQAAYQRAQSNRKGLAAAGLLALQRTVGNRQVQRLLGDQGQRQTIQTKSQPASVAPLVQRPAMPADEKSQVMTVRVATGNQAAHLNRDRRAAASGQNIYKSSESKPQPVQVIRTVSRLNRAMIQRFDPAVDDPYVPTADRQHPALANIGLKGMGPYKFYPMQGVFKYQPPPIAGGADKFLGLLLKHKTAGAQYEPEKIAPVGGGYQWQVPVGGINAGKKITFHAKGIMPANPVDRVNEATNLYLNEKVGNVVVGKVLDAMKAHNHGKTPRPFVSVVTEDAYGAAEHAHTTSRHVIGGAEAPDEDAVAARAAFGMLGGLVGGAVKGAYTITASAFKTVADANMDVGNAIAGELTKNWNNHRMDIITKGGIDLQVARAGGQIIAYETTNAGGKWPDVEKPTYLVPGSKGQKPLYYPDPRWDKWAAGPGGWIRGPLAWVGAAVWGGPPFSAAQTNKLKGQPLTIDVSAKLKNVNVRILASDTPAYHGWFIHSAYPIY